MPPRGPKGELQVLWPRPSVFLFVLAGAGRATAAPKYAGAFLGQRARGPPRPLRVTPPLERAPPLECGHAPGCGPAHHPAAWPCSRSVATPLGVGPPPCGPASRAPRRGGLGARGPLGARKRSVRPVARGLSPPGGHQQQQSSGTSSSRSGNGRPAVAEAGSPLPRARENCPQPGRRAVQRGAAGRFCRGLPVNSSCFGGVSACHCCSLLLCHRRQLIKERARPDPIKLLWTLKSEAHVIFTCHKIFVLVKCKTILSSLAVNKLKQAVFLTQCPLSGSSICCRHVD